VQLHQPCCANVQECNYARQSLIHPRSEGGGFTMSQTHSCTLDLINLSMSWRSRTHQRGRSSSSGCIGHEHMHARTGCMCDIWPTQFALIVNYGGTCCNGHSRYDVHNDFLLGRGCRHGGARSRRCALEQRTGSPRRGVRCEARDHAMSWQTECPTNR
jgi:hypothetical protein